jgi:DNA-binding response OmpR family regulator
MARLLIVEDEWLIAAEYVAILRSHGHSTAGPFARVAPALAAVEAGGIDAALLDMNLGTETSLPIAHLLQARSIPFAFLTGHATKQAVSVFSAAPLLSKPVMPKELLAVLEELCPPGSC